MKSVVLLGRARKALLKHRNIAPRILEKLRAYAADPVPAQIKSPNCGVGH
jgi:hypothetical protein